MGVTAFSPLFSLNLIYYVRVVASVQPPIQQAAVAHVVAGLEDAEEEDEEEAGKEEAEDEEEGKDLITITGWFCSGMETQAAAVLNAPPPYGHVIAAEKWRNSTLVQVLKGISLPF